MCHHKSWQLRHEWRKFLSMVNIIGLYNGGLFTVFYVLMKFEMAEQTTV